MQLHQPITLEGFEPAADVAGNEVAPQPASARSWDFVSPNRDEVLELLMPGRDRKRTIILIAGALVVGFGLGSACGPIIAALSPAIQPSSHRTAEVKSGGKIDGVRKTVSTPGLQTPGVNAVSVTGAIQPAKPSGGVRPSVDSASTPPLTQASATITAREPIVAAPETRPTTIEGWTVLDVRGGTVVLEGPDGVRTAARGDTVPGIGRIDSIVRWGNRWIVATASGLIATP
jgi:hypothetical protein